MVPVGSSYAIGILISCGECPWKRPSSNMVVGLLSLLSVIFCSLEIRSVFAVISSFFRLLNPF